MTAAKKLANSGACLEAGRVERVGATIEVRLFQSKYQAQRAKSCLVAPETGDKVLCAIEPEGVYVLAVLDGREGAPTKLATDGDLEVQARGGRIAVCASERVDIVGAREVAMTGAEVHVRAKRGSIAIEELGFFGRLLQAEVTKVALVAQEADTMLTRWTQRAKRVFRFIEELDQTRAGTIDLRAQSLVGIRAENAIISARVLAKVDGEQIHLG
ncbi:DUF3540 domain-containing protein [Sorangium sp. So ce1153]|uniref:DUF3540 domain-containing protein n=1 Tax=Sorangium sp. So ce1153 TaxID=3133333 RepID=UPI003F620FBF